MKKFLIILIILSCFNMKYIQAGVFSKKFNINDFSNARWEQENKVFIELLNNMFITIIAPSSGVDKKILSLLHNLPSLKLKLPTYVALHANAFCLETIDKKFTSLERVLCDETDREISVVWALRGGFTTTLLISALQKIKKPHKEKIFIGFSDMTPLHLFLTQKWGWKTIHGSVITQILDPYYDRTNFISIAEIITKKITKISIDALNPINDTAKTTQVVSGTMTGGNLMLVEASIGTCWQVQTKNKILFLEVNSIQEDALTIFLNHFDQVGLFQHVSAILFGCIGNDDTNIIRVLNNFASNLTIPVFKTNKFGHKKYNYPIIYNTESQIVSNHDKEKSFSLIMKV